MKITAVKPYSVAHERNFFFVVVETDEGIRGIGEGGITWQEKGTAGIVDSLTPLLIGEDPFRTEHLWQLMFRGGFFPLGRIGCAALSAIDIALWDIKAKALKVAQPMRPIKKKHCIITPRIFFFRTRPP